MRLGLFILPFAAFLFLGAGQAVACDQPGPLRLRTMQLLQKHSLDAIPSFRAQPACYSWPHYYLAAQALSQASGRKGANGKALMDEAVFWFYAGQLRARVASGFDPVPARSKTLFASLTAEIGVYLNQYAARDLDNFQATIGRVLEWDAQHKLNPDDSFPDMMPLNASEEAWDKAYASAVENMTLMRERVMNDAKKVEAIKHRRRGGVQ